MTDISHSLLILIFFLFVLYFLTINYIYIHFLHDKLNRLNYTLINWNFLFGKEAIFTRKYKQDGSKNKSGVADHSKRQTISSVIDRPTKHKMSYLHNITITNLMKYFREHFFETSYFKIETRQRLFWIKFLNIR